MNRISPEFDVRAQQLREIRDAKDAICPSSSPRALAPARGGWITAIALLSACYYWLALPLWQTLCIAFVGGVAVRTAVRRFGRKPEDGTPRLESLLLAYDPVDKYAFRSLQRDVAKHGFTVYRLGVWLDHECVALHSEHGLHPNGGSAASDQHCPTHLVDRARQLKRLGRTTELMAMGVNSTMLRAMAWGLPVFAGIEILKRYDVSPGSEWWRLPQILMLLSMLALWFVGKRHAPWNPQVEEQIRAYQPVNTDDYQRLLANTAVHGLQVREVQDWIFWEIKEINALLNPKGAPDSPFVQKQVE